MLGPLALASQRTYATGPFFPVFNRLTLAGYREMLGSKEGEVIKKVKGGYKVLSESGKNLGGPYKSKAQAEKRLRQVEFFKHRKG